MVIFGKTADGDVEILKVAVKPAYRNQGIARHLIYNCILYAREVGAFRIVVLVPEGQLRPGETGDISQWLGKLGFRAQVPLLKDYFVFYGQAEDGVIFSLSIPQA
jgi:GNAT superfamily N-acetyltransferase